MDKLPYTELSRRGFIGGCIGGAAILQSRGNVNTAAAPPSETNGGGEFCTEPPNEEGARRLEEMHVDAEPNVIPDRYEVAERYGLTLANKEAVKDLYIVLTEANSLDEAISAMNTFTEESLGFKTSMATESVGDESRYVVEDLPEMKIRLAGMVETISMLPRELYDAIWFKEFSIEDIPDSPGADYNFSTGIIRLDPEAIGDAAIICHELGHAANMTACGTFPDGAFSDTLPEGVAYGDAWQTVEDWEYSFVTPYGMKNDKEDSAMVIAAWMTGNLGLDEEHRGTPLYEKLLIIMDRYDTLVPGIVQYIEEAVRPAIKNKRVA